MHPKSIMPNVFLVNVGANTSHGSKARSPLFKDGTFNFVSFPDDGCRRQYPPEVHSFVSDSVNLRTHLDPDWHNLTYGDCCDNRRARALLNAEVGDILLFWGLLWRIPNKNANVLKSSVKTWCLFGAMRVEAILESKQTITHLTPSQKKRVIENEHMAGNSVDGRKFARVFIADKKHSCQFERAVDLEIYDDDGLLRQTIKAKDGRSLEWDRSPKWYSALRSCRAVFDLSDSDQRKRAIRLNKRIQSVNGHIDMLAGLTED